MKRNGAARGKGTRPILAAACLAVISLWSVQAWSDAPRMELDTETEGCLVRLTVRYFFHDEGPEPTCEFTIQRTHQGDTDRVFSGRVEEVSTQCRPSSRDGGVPLQLCERICEAVEDRPPGGVSVYEAEEVHDYWGYNPSASASAEVPDHCEVPEHCTEGCCGCSLSHPGMSAGWLVVLLLLLAGGLAEATSRARR